MKNNEQIIDCQYCEETKAYAEHTHDESGYCTTCNQPVAPSEGILYDLSAIMMLHDEGIGYLCRNHLHDYFLCSAHCFTIRYIAFPLLLLFP